MPLTSITSKYGDRSTRGGSKQTGDRSTRGGSKSVLPGYEADRRSIYKRGIKRSIYKRGIKTGDRSTRGGSKQTGDRSIRGGSKSVLPGYEADRRSIYKRGIKRQTEDRSTRGGSKSVLPGYEADRRSIYKRGIKVGTSRLRGRPEIDIQEGDQSRYFSATRQTGDRSTRGGSKSVLPGYEADRRSIYKRGIKRSIYKRGIKTGDRSTRGGSKQTGDRSTRGGSKSVLPGYEADRRSIYKRGIKRQTEDRSTRGGSKQTGDRSTREGSKSVLPGYEADRRSIYKRGIKVGTSRLRGRPEIDLQEGDQSRYFPATRQTGDRSTRGGSKSVLPGYEADRRSIYKRGIKVGTSRLRGRPEIDIQEGDQSQYFPATRQTGDRSTRGGSKSVLPGYGADRRSIYKRWTKVGTSRLRGRPEIDLQEGDQSRYFSATRQTGDRSTRGGSKSVLPGYEADRRSIYKRGIKADRRSIYKRGIKVGTSRLRGRPEIDIQEGDQSQYFPATRQTGDRSTRGGSKSVLPGYGADRRSIYKRWTKADRRSIYKRGIKVGTSRLRGRPEIDLQEGDQSRYFPATRQTGDRSTRGGSKSVLSGYEADRRSIYKRGIKVGTSRLRGRPEIDLQEGDQSRYFPATRQTGDRSTRGGSKSVLPGYEADQK
ncbi:hypothetical protein DPMN_159266 [Dreissena polymorpha]|uniref:Uncharacterized protein n=1 Tax=Dreissena polymorpha TaxID=45954 RepID=A0A9D4EL88_DREPO|nr:hypothetical protein DPMN_159266 [Dreissena polymorpha]